MTELKTRLAITVLEQAPCQAAVIDTSRRVVLANDSFYQTFGHRDGAHCYEVCKGLDGPCEGCFAERTFELGTAHVSDERGRNRAGDPITYQVKSVPMLSEEGEVECVALLCVDTTAVTALEDELSQAERIAKVGLTAAGLAHTIKNILAGVDGAFYTVSSGLERQDLERVGVGWEMVQTYIEQVSVLVQNLLGYAKQQEPHREATDPATLVKMVVELFESKAGLANIQLRGQVERGLPLVWLDPQAMHACLTNLVSNAIDACTWDPEKKDHQILVSASARPDGGVFFEVEDDGMGISVENQHKILTAFFTTKGMRGTGLGLLLTKKAIEEHGGSVDFSSSPGRGTTFRIELPVGAPRES